MDKSSSTKIKNKQQLTQPLKRTQDVQPNSTSNGHTLFVIHKKGHRQYQEDRKHNFPVLGQQEQLLDTIDCTQTRSYTYIKDAAADNTQRNRKPVVNAICDSIQKLWWCVCVFVCEMYRYSCKDIQQTENIQYDCIHPHVVHTPESKEKSNPMNKTTKENRQQQNNTPETTKQHDNTIDIGVWAVFDGHEGDDVSKWLSQNMEQMLMENIQKKPPTTITQMKNLIIRTFCRLDARIACHQSGTDDLVRAQHHTKGLVDARSEVKKEEEEEDKELEEAGSTAAVVLLYRGRLYVAHVGDSRVIVVHPKTGNIIHETLDMTAQNVKSKQHKEFLSDWKRIQRTGGVLEEEKEEGGLVYLFGAETNVQCSGENKRQSVGLMVTRAFGDSTFKSSGLLSSRPIVHSIKIKEPVYVVIASDGVWDTVNSSDIGKWIVEGVRASKKHKNTRKTHQTSLSCTSFPYISTHKDPSPLKNEFHSPKSKPDVFQRFFEERLRILDPDDNYTMMIVKVWPSKST